MGPPEFGCLEEKIHVMDPFILDIPDVIVTPRLHLRAPDPVFAEALSEGIFESLERLRRWMPWAAEEPVSLDMRRRLLRERYADYYLRRDLMLLMFRREDGEFVGGTGLHRIDWSVPKFEIGYWVRTRDEGRGYVSEAVSTLTDFAFTSLRAQRVEIRCDSLNDRSAAIPRRLGFVHEATLRSDRRAAQAPELRDTLIFARTATR